MKDKLILFSLVSIMTASRNINSMEKIKPALPLNFYTSLAHSYVVAHKNHPHFKDNLEQKKDWLKQKLHTHKNKCLTLHVTKKDGKSYKIQGLNPLPNIQDYLQKITQMAKQNNDQSLENLFSSYLQKLNQVWQLSICMRLKRYFGENEQLENQGLTQISEHIFKTTFMIWGSLNDIDKIYAVEALHFTSICLQILNNENISNQNSDSESSSD